MGYGGKGVICRSRRFVGRRGFRNEETRARGRVKAVRFGFIAVSGGSEVGWVSMSYSQSQSAYSQGGDHTPTDFQPIFGSESYQLQDSGRRGRTGVSVSKYKRCLDNLATRLQLPRSGQQPGFGIF